MTKECAGRWTRAQTVKKRGGCGVGSIKAEFSVLLATHRLKFVSEDEAATKGRTLVYASRLHSMDMYSVSRKEQRQREREREKERASGRENSGHDVIYEWCDAGLNGGGSKAY